MATHRRTTSVTKKRLRDRGGCGFLIATCAVSYVFFVLNRSFAQHVFTAISPAALPVSRRTAQFLLFAFPVAMIFVQWWIVDLIVKIVSFFVRRDAEPDWEELDPR